MESLDQEMLIENEYLFKNDLYSGITKGVGSPTRRPSSLAKVPSKRSISTLVTNSNRRKKMISDEQRRIDLENSHLARRIIEKPGDISVDKFEKDFKQHLYLRKKSSKVAKSKLNPRLLKFRELAPNILQSDRNQVQLPHIDPKYTNRAELTIGGIKVEVDENTAMQIE